MATYRPQLGEKEGGVVTQRDMREALRLMGWGADETSAHIVEAWYGKLKNIYITVTFNAGKMSGSRHVVVDTFNKKNLFTDLSFRFDERDLNQE